MATTYTASPALAAAPTWRRQPYRVMFLLGLALAWSGVVPWLLHGLGVVLEYRSIYHSIAQVQGFMMCFAAGFLFTAIPRLTGTSPPASWQMVIAMLAPVGTVAAAWFRNWPLSQMFWFGLVATLLVFAVRRFRSGTRRPPASFVWVPLSLGMGAVGSVLIAAYGIGGAQLFHLHQLGRLLLLQGMFLGLVSGVGSMALPLVTCGDPPPDAGREARPQRLLHLAAAFALIGTFLLENYVSLQWGYGLRAALVLAVLVSAGRIHRLPTVAGWHRWLVWLSAWLLPLGYSLGCLFPLQFQAGLHVVFIGGFGMLALSVGLHVSLALGGRDEVHGRPWQVPILGALLLLAMASRGALVFVPAQNLPLLAVAAAAFLLATLVWASLAIPAMLVPFRSEQAPTVER